MRLKRLVVMISGGGSNMQAVLSAIKAGEIAAEVVGVIASKKKAYGLTRAVDAGIKSKVVCRKDFETKQAFDEANIKAINSFKPDGIILAGYLSMIGKRIIENYPNQIINIHPSLIPAFCGKGFYGNKVHQGVLDYGAKVSGATTHFVDEGADTGPVIMQKSVPVMTGDTVEVLAARVLKVEHEILVKTLKAYCADAITISGRKVSIKA